MGRILRPKAGQNQAHFYTIVSGDTVEQEFAHKRQLFLCEQGYAYDIVDEGQVKGLNSIRRPASGVCQKPVGRNKALRSSGS